MVKVGAATETEMKEKKHRVEDALQATRAALEEGIVPGGGVALLNAVDSIKLDEMEGDERTGAQIIVRALEEPLRQLAYNAGLEGSVVVNNVRTAAKGQGLNVDTNEVEDLVKAGIIDPTMVTRSALQNAASIAQEHPHDRGDRRRATRKGRSRHGRRHGRHGRHGRNDVRQANQRNAVQLEGRPERRPSAVSPATAHRRKKEAGALFRTRRRGRRGFARSDAVALVGLVASQARLPRCL